MTLARRLLLFTKPAVPGRVKTRLHGALTPEQAAELHQAFVDDVLERLTPGAFELVIAWALAPGEAVPETHWPSVVQRGDGLGDRLFTALADAARGGATVAALGSDHPTLPLAIVESAFARVEAGAPIVIGPSLDGGYYLIALAPAAVRPELFADIAWSTSEVLATTLERAAALGLPVALLPPGADVDTPEDLAALATALGTQSELCPRTRALLTAWGRLAEREVVR
ncbi:MAG: TIGR04282 family arsenosugar biosynthesis glycosyltransferase [Thermoanaerobaculia bacterium]|nr:TIGR04282 family arsenosugar biosynthesis glycosyltransferase [Thermoanaerobaculia bacterium]